MTGSEESAMEETTPEWIRIDGVESWARLEADGTLLWSAGAGERRLLLESDVLGLATGGPWITVRAFEGTSEGGCCGVVGGAGGRRRARRDYVLQMADEAAARRWSDRINEFLVSLGRPKKLCIVLNPFSGKKSARKIFQDEIKPLLEAAGVLFDLKETERQNHAHEIAYKLDILQYDGIVCVSGDGILLEIVNGLLNRKDWGTAIKVPLGVIPAGTGNGMAKSLLDSADDLCTVSNATFTIIRGHALLITLFCFLKFCSFFKCVATYISIRMTSHFPFSSFCTGRRRALDVATILQNEKKFFNVLSLTWGLVADIDIESERYRWMGSARMDLYALFRVLNLRKYNGHIHFIPAPGFEAYGDPVIHVDDCKCDILLSRWGKGGNDSTEQRKYMGPEVAMEGMEWRSIDGPFISVLVHNVPFSTEDYMPAPKAEFADGYLDVVIVKDSPKSRLLEMMLTMSDGSYIKSPYILYFKVKALRLQPGSRVGQPTKGGIIDSDGEVIAGGDEPESCLMAYGPPIQMTVDKGLATIFSP